MAKTTRRPRLPVRLEHVEQVELMSWARANEVRYPELCLLFAVPNGARTSMRTAVKLKMEGLRAGVPDLVLPVARGKYHGLFLELKREKGGVVSAAQRSWHDHLRWQLYRVDVCHGADEAKRSLVEYLALPEDRPQLTHADRDDDAA